jgi:hypothetical protein
MSTFSFRKKLALVVIDTESLTYTRYLGTEQDRIVAGALLTASEVEWFRINPTDFIQTQRGGEVA